MPAYRIAFAIAVCLGILSAVLFSHYRQIHDTHTQVQAMSVSVEARTTRVNNNSAQRLYHPIFTVPLEDGGSQTVIFKKGEVRADLYGKHRPFDVLYPHGHPEDARIPEMLDLLWPAMLAAALAVLALAAGVLFRREEQKIAASKGA